MIGSGLGICNDVLNVLLEVVLFLIRELFECEVEGRYSMFFMSMRLCVEHGE